MSTPEILLKEKDLKNFFASLPESGPCGEEIFKNNEESVKIFKITTSESAGLPEIHENYTDIFLVREGKEEFFVGGEMAGKKSIGSGEWRGSGLSGARRYLLAPGDIFIIPKNIPHQHGRGVIKTIVIKIG